ncbi:hypothetical protein RD792_000253 [Penstemon davidsonii]|uniref:Pentatricopeptide repeat-containing protein n=1 Tax=Penstemon davidsonii TaxID=160366 RepID=A0ABR0DVP3_9LAMI|nr:hypothetical protein RD792_000253 [Penstemon davidsonii]
MHQNTALPRSHPTPCTLRQDRRPPPPFCFLCFSLFYTHRSINNLAHAQSIVAALPNHNDTAKETTLFHYNILIICFVQNHRSQDALHLLLYMLSLDFLPDEFTFLCVFKACANLRSFAKVRMIHGLPMKLRFGSGFRSGMHLESSLVNFYSKCGDVDSARKVFDKMCDRDLVTWNALLDCYAKCGGVGDGEESVEMAFRLFDEMPERDVVSWTVMIDGLSKSGREMFNEGFKANVVTLVCVLSTISGLAFLSKVKSVQNQTWIRWRAWKKLGHWTTIIVGLEIHGMASDALNLLNEIQIIGVKPDAITFVGELNACNHVGLVDEGKRYFDVMVKEYGIEPTIEHYGCLVDIRCRYAI